MKIKFQTIVEKTAKSFRDCILAILCSPGGFNQFFTTIVFVSTEVTGAIRSFLNDMQCYLLYLLNYFIPA